MASMKESIVSRLSVSVGSIIRASSTIRGTVVEEPLGDVQGLHARGLEVAVREHELVQAGQVVGAVVLGLEQGQQVAGVEHRQLGDPRHAGRAQLAQVGVGLHQHAEVAEEAPHSADAQGAVRVEPPASLAVRLDERRRQEGLEGGGDPDRPRAWPAAAVGRGEGLVQVELHDVGAPFPGAALAEDGVEVGAGVLGLVSMRPAVSSDMREAR